MPHKVLASAKRRYDCPCRNGGRSNAATIPPRAAAANSQTRGPHRPVSGSRRKGPRNCNVFRGSNNKRWINPPPPLRKPRFFHFFVEFPIFLWYHASVKNASLTCCPRLRQTSAVARRRRKPASPVQPILPVLPVPPPVVCGRGDIEPGCDEPRKRTVLMPKIAPYRRLSHPIAAYRTLKKQGGGAGLSRRSLAKAESRQGWVQKWVFYGISVESAIQALPSGRECPFHGCSRQATRLTCALFYDFN